MLDARGVTCPEPIMMLHRALRKVPIGEVICVQASDVTTQRDIPKFCEFLPHQLIRSEVRNGDYWFWIEKGARS